MKKTMMSLLLALCMVLSLTACAGETVPETTTTTATLVAQQPTSDDGSHIPATWDRLSWMEDTSPMTMELFMDQSWFVFVKDNGSGSWGDDLISQEVTRLTGVSLNVYKQTSDASNPQLGERDFDTLLASNELPDLVFTEDHILEMQDEKVSWNWDELTEKYCPEFWDLVDPVEKLNNVAADGHIYTLRTEYYGENAYSDKGSLGVYNNSFPLFYRADVMEKLNLPMFTSVETLEDTLYKVKENREAVGIEYPFDGQDEEEGQLHNILRYWMGCQAGNRWIQEEKSIKTQYTDSAWLEYYKLMNRWYRDGILNPDYVTGENLDQRMYSQTTFALSGMAADSPNAMLRMMEMGGKSDDTSQPVFARVMDNLTYNNEMQAVFTDYAIGRDGLFITKNCTNPQRAIRFAEFLRSPVGDKLTNWGIEGVYYEMQEDGTWKRPESYYQIPMEDQYLKMHIGSWALMQTGWSLGVRMTSYSAEFAAQSDSYAQEEYEEYKEYTLRQKELTYENKNPVMVYARIDPTDPEYENYTQIQAQWEELKNQLINAESEARVEQLWMDFQDELEKLGIDSIEKRMTQRYLENLKRYQDAGYYTDIG